MALGGVAVALIAILVAIILVRLLARPIRAVSSNALKVGDFDLKDFEILPPSRIREIDDEAAAFNRMLAGLRSFETYVPRALVARLMQSGAAQMVASEQRKVTVMFTDIVGYTASSETQTATEAATSLNEHFTQLGCLCRGRAGHDRQVRRRLAVGVLGRTGAARPSRTPGLPRGRGRRPRGWRGKHGAVNFGVTVGPAAYRHPYRRCRRRQYRRAEPGQLYDCRRHGKHLPAARVARQGKRSGCWCHYAHKRQYRRGVGRDFRDVKCRKIRGQMPPGTNGGVPFGVIVCALTPFRS